MAGGLSVEPEGIEAFRIWILEHMHQFAEERAEARRLDIDGVLAPGVVTPDLCDKLEAIGPFGQGAPQPVFSMRSIKPVSARRIGQNHVRFFAEDPTGRVECVSWRTADMEIGQALFAGERLHIVGRIKADEWNGRRRAQLELIDAAPVDEN